MSVVIRPSIVNILYDFSEAAGLIGTKFDMKPSWIREMIVYTCYLASEIHIHVHLSLVKKITLG